MLPEEQCVLCTNAQVLEGPRRFALEPDITMGAEFQSATFHSKSDTCESLIARRDYPSCL